MGFAGIGAAVAVALSIVGAGAALSADAAPSGATLYAEHCAGCHGLSLGGSSGPAIGPALKGEVFVAKWGRVPASAFAAYVHRTMPLNQPGSLDEASSTAVANFVLANNRLAPAPAMPASKTAAMPKSRVMWPEDQGMPIQDEDRDAAYRATLDARAALIGRMSPVDDKLLDKPNERDWLSWRGNAGSHGYSPLQQIDRGNVGTLGLAWSLSLAPGTNAIAPIVHDGVMFINSNGTVQALDARNGESIWKFVRPATTTRVPNSQTRGMALYGGALYVPTIDNHVIALDARTGKVRWDHVIGKPDEQLQLTAAPLVVRGKVIQGVAGCQGGEYGGGCYIVALDAATGEEAWRFQTIARPGEPGGDSWNGAAWNKRYGGSVWVTGSYDAALNLVYFGVGQTYSISTLLDPQGRKGASTDALFTNTTLAINPDSGKLVWHYQHAPGDVWDLDWSFERTLATVGGRRIVVTGGKLGIFDALDAKTGRYLWSRDLGLQNLVTAIDPKSGRKSYDPALTPVVGTPRLVCPSTIGNRNWMSTAYDPGTHMLYVPVTPTCMDYSRMAQAGSASLEGFGELKITPRRRPDSDGQHGWLAAIDIAGNRIAWIDKQRAPQASAALATAGGIVFQGGSDRSFGAVDSATGAVLWRTVLPATPNAFPLSYMVDGVQYVGVVTGGGTPVDAFQSAMAPEFAASSRGKTIMVFALPAGR